MSATGAPFRKITSVQKQVHVGHNLPRGRMPVLSVVGAAEKSANPNDYLV